MPITITSLEIEIIIKLITALLLGTLIGLEREIHKTPAGMRTHILVILGATLFTIVALRFNVPWLTGGIVTGIGFLGGGMIWHTKNKIIGLTTAADIWALTAIGIAVGYGLYFAAVTTVILILIVLYPLKKIEQKTIKKR